MQHQQQPIMGISAVSATIAATAGQKRKHASATSSSSSSQSQSQSNQRAKKSLTTPATSSPQSPSLYIAQLYSEQGLKIEPARDQTYFIKPTQDMIESYDKDVLKAVRQKDLAMLRTLHTNGKNLQCCNRFGESLIHMACRNGLADIVRFLVKEAKVSLYVRDDYGRTPAHDACWTVKPNLDLMEFLIQEAPELLGLSDVRGHTPFAYARKNHWGKWMDFLLKHDKQMLIPSSSKKQPMNVVSSLNTATNSILTKEEATTTGSTAIVG